MKILVCNDDGVHAPGITILAHTLREIAEVTVVAPLSERSTTGHTLTLDHPLRLVPIGPSTYGCSGYPADCALVGLTHVMQNDRPDVVVSGINKGANLGQDIYYSGTVAAAREAAFRGVPSIAVSSVMDFLDPNPQEDFFQTAADFVKDFLLSGLHLQINSREVININVPDVPTQDIKGVVSTQLGFRHYSQEVSERQDFKNRKYYWVGGVYSGFETQPGSDCQAIDEGLISVSALNLPGAPTDRLEQWRENLERLPKTWRRL